jgi:hypothetical protein
MSDSDFIAAVKSEFYNGNLDTRHSYESLAGERTKPNIICINNVEVGCMALQRNRHMKHGWIQIAYIFIYNPKIGIGSKIMSRLCDLADQYNVNLFLDAVPQKSNGKSIDRGKLICWYMGFKFKTASEGSNLMERIHNV